MAKAMGLINAIVLDIGRESSCALPIMDGELNHSLLDLLDTMESVSTKGIKGVTASVNGINRY